MAVCVREWTAVAFWVEIQTALKSDVDCLTALGEDGRSRASVWTFHCQNAGYECSSRIAELNQNADKNNLSMSSLILELTGLARASYQGPSGQKLYNCWVTFTYFPGHLHLSMIENRTTHNERIEYFPAVRIVFRSWDGRTLVISKLALIARWVWPN